MRWHTAFDSLEPGWLRQLADQHGTPLVIYDQCALRARWQAVQQAFRNVQLFLPFKACATGGIRRLLCEWGMGADVASPLEFQAALELGLEAGRLLLNQPLRDPALLANAAALGVVVVADGFDDVRRACDQARSGGELRMLMRVNPGVGAPVWSRFGMDLDSHELLQAAELAGRTPGVTLLGLHQHLGSNIWTDRPYLQAVTRIADIWEQIERAAGRPLRVLDIGGGFATPYCRPLNRPPESWRVCEPEQLLSGIRSTLDSHGLEPELWAEPGRLLLQDAALLLTRVTRVREAAFGPMTTCDAGINLLSTASYLSHPLAITRDVQADGAVSRDFDVFGSLCMQADLLAVGARLPADLAAGDLLRFGSVGAYDIALSFPFIVGRCPVLLRRDDGTVQSLRRRETLADLQQLETLP